MFNRVPRILFRTHVADQVHLKLPYEIWELSFTAPNWTSIYTPLPYKTHQNKPFLALFSLTPQKQTQEKTKFRRKERRRKREIESREEPDKRENQTIMAVNITAIKTSSNGIWQGDDPLHFAFPLLILQTVLVLVLSRLLAFLFRPLRQPKVIAEIIVWGLN